MKRLYQEARWKRYSARRSRRELKRRRIRRRWKKRSRRATALRQKPLGGKRIKAFLKAPEVFSVAKNPTEMCRFLQAVIAYRRKRQRVFVELANITDLTIDGPAALMAVMKDRRYKRGTVSGNLPENLELRRILVDCGFTQFVVLTKKGYGGVVQGRMFRKRGYDVEAASAAGLCQTVSEGLTGERRYIPPVQRVFLEAMHNTHDHAAPDEGRKLQWWTSGYYRREKHKAFFAFVDTGVGILESAPFKPLQVLTSAVSGGRARLLRDVIHGRIRSRTELPHRGKGLPASARWRSEAS